MGPLAIVLLAFVPDDVVVPPLLEIGGLPPCVEHSDCPGKDQYCDGAECVQCLDASHCSDGWDCDAGYCDDACTTDRDCEGVDDAWLCDPQRGFCRECLGADDCPAAEYCAYSGRCIPDHCDPGDRWCYGLQIVECDDDGGTTIEVERCTDLCDDTGEEPICTQPGTDTSSGSTGGTSTGPDSTTSTPSTESDSDSDTDTDADADPPSGLETRGCTCRTAPASAWLLLLALPAIRRRRR